MAFELVNLAGHFLRHSGFQIKVAEDDNTKLFQEDASFISEHALILSVLLLVVLQLLGCFWWSTRTNSTTANFVYHCFP